MTLENLAIHFQSTGEYLPEAAEYENAFIYDNVQLFYDEYIERAEVRDKPFGLFVLLKVSEWQADNGFVVEYDMDNISEIIGDLSEGGNYDPTDEDGGNSELN